jgi:transcriptional regulator with XRE-family HTH domain
MAKQISWAEGHRLIEKVGGEDHLALRVTTERNRLGLSQEKLAEAMVAAGCPVPQSAISKIENPGRGGRRAISVEEAIAFAKVFDVPLGELLLPPDVVRDKVAWQGYVRATELQAQIRTLTNLYEDELLWLRSAAAASEPLRRELLAHGSAVRRKVTADLREIAINDGDDPATVSVAMPAAVTVIDDILRTEEP